MKKLKSCGILMACMLLLVGCTLLSEEKVKLRDLDFTVLSEEKIPEQLMAVIEEKKAAPFHVTYTDNDNLYICGLRGAGDRRIQHRGRRTVSDRFQYLCGHQPVGAGGFG